MIESSVPATVTIVKPHLPARRVKVCSKHLLQIWLHLLGICKISKTNKLISLLKKWTPYDIQVLPPLNFQGWTTAHFQKCMCMQDVLDNVIEHITKLKC